MMRFVMIGGFLGAGKTTAIAKLARTYQEQGLNVGIVTNDQAADLVDTLSLRSQGFDVGEVAGSCFCCNFNDLTSTIDQLAETQKPDVVIAEPVGSCTDLVATVIQPMIHIHQGQFKLAPYGVILKPTHGLKILGGQKDLGFSPKAAYIFTKQLEEADFAIINHIDRLNEEQIGRLVELMQKNYPSTPIVKLSALTGQGMQDLLEMLDREGEFGNKILDLDYDVYADGEAELGWLNASLKMHSGSPVELDKLTLSLVQGIQSQLAQSNSEVAHLKVIALWDGAHAVANLTSSDSDAVLSLPSDCLTSQADLVINARVAIDPALLSSAVDEAVRLSESEYAVELKQIRSQFFKPGRPVPTHRFGTN